MAASLLLGVLPASADTAYVPPLTQSAVSTSQYSLSNSDGITWQDIDPTKLRVRPSSSGGESTWVSASADLFTGNAGVNQDIGIFVSARGGPDQLLAWKESGGSAGTFSPNAAYVQTLYTLTGDDIFKLKWKTSVNAPNSTIYAGAGPISGVGGSPTSLSVETFAQVNSLQHQFFPPNFAVSNSNYTLSNSDGATWQPIDAANLATTLSPAASGRAVLGASADLWTYQAGYSQDLGIFVSDNGGADTLVAWKESQGFGAFSPNATFVKANLAMTAGHSYAFKLKWKTNRNASGVNISAGAGPISGQWSPTSLLAQYIPSGPSPYSSVSTARYSLSGSDGAAWQPMDSALNLSVSAAVDSNALLGANVDLFSNTAGYNQDIGLFVSDNGGADRLVAWKESGGFVANSPNAAFAQAIYPMTAGHTYVFKLTWKVNKSASGVTIYAGAGAGAPFSPTRLSAEVTGLSKMLAWGNNSYGQLGNGNGPGSNVPVAAYLPYGTTITAVAAGSLHSLAVTSTGSVLAWGDNSYGQLGSGCGNPVALCLPSGTIITAVAAGAYHSLALTSTGSVFAWGSGGEGELGNGTVGNSASPVPVRLPAGTTITAISAGDQFSLAVTSTGSVLGWGFNRYGELGNGQSGNGADTNPVPGPVSLPSGTTITAVSAGGFHSLALTSTGSVLAWGDNRYWQLGNAALSISAVPVSVSVPPNITAVAAGSIHSLALSSNGSVYAWGRNYYGQLGNGTNTDSPTPLPVMVPAGTTITAIAAGGGVAYPFPGFSQALTSTGSVLAWGYNLGNGTNCCSAVPVPVSLPDGTTITAVSAGGFHSLAIVR